MRQLMRLTYVIPDLHARYDLLDEALAGIAAHARGETGTIVTIGDYVDKGPDSKAVIDRLLSGVGPAWNLVALRGNHDAMMVEALRDPSKMAAWLGEGGDAGRRGPRPRRRRPRRRAANPHCLARGASADVSRRTSALRSRRRRSRNTAGSAERGDAAVEALSQGIS